MSKNEREKKRMSLFKRSDIFFCFSPTYRFLHRESLRIHICDAHAKYTRIKRRHILIGLTFCSHSYPKFEAK